jgi:hypothetical protein
MGTKTDLAEYARLEYLLNDVASNMLQKHNTYHSQLFEVKQLSYSLTCSYMQFILKQKTAQIIGRKYTSFWRLIS